MLFELFKGRVEPEEETTGGLLPLAVASSGETRLKRVKQRVRLICLGARQSRA